jgi:hypothetical protein
LPPWGQNSQIFLHHKYEKKNIDWKAPPKVGSDITQKSNKRSMARTITGETKREGQREAEKSKRAQSLWWYGHLVNVCALCFVVRCFDFWVVSPVFLVLPFGLAYQCKDIVFKFTIEYSSLRDFGPLGNRSIFI